MDTVRILIRPVQAVIHGPHEVLQQVREFLTVVSPGAKHTPAFKSGRWDGRLRFMRQGSNLFPAGLTGRVVKFLYDQGIGCSIQHEADPFLVSRILKPEFVKKCLYGIELRDYQVEAVLRAIKARRAAIQLPTGSGKTEVGAAIIKLVRKPTLWLVHRKELMHQTQERLLLRILGSDAAAMTNRVFQGRPTVGVVGSSLHLPGFITVGMVQSLAKLIEGRHEDWFSQFEVLIVDEVHHLSASTWYDIAKACAKAGYRFGLSGTIVTGNELKDFKLEAATGPLMKIAETMELVDQGFLAKPIIIMTDVGRKHYPSYETVREKVLPDWHRDPRRLSKMGGALHRMAYQMGIIDNEARNNAIVTTALQHANRGEKVLVLCVRLSHGKRLLNKLSESPLHHIKLAWLHGKENDEVRQTVLSHFKEDKEGTVLVASTIFDEGLDIPEIDALVLAGGGESFVKTIQRPGRALRTRPDKTEVLIYDYFDGWDRKKKDYLGQHALARLKEYEGQGFEVRHVGGRNR